MQSFSRGWSFLGQAWSMAFKDKDLLKPSLYSLIVGRIVSAMTVYLIYGYLAEGDGGMDKAQVQGSTARVTASVPLAAVLG